MATSSSQNFIAKLPSQHVEALWTVMHAMVPTRPTPKASVAVWRYADLRPLLLEAGKTVSAEQAERRVLMLVNPSLKAPFTTDTVYAGLQLINPGETAPAHRHQAFALRFIIEGSKGFTAVKGQKVFMQEGDLILTPQWQWHDHGHEGDGPMIWLDGLDLPLYHYFPTHFAETYCDARYPSRLVSESPLRFPWVDTEAKLCSEPGDWAQNEYRTADGDHISRTLGAHAERVTAGKAGSPPRDTSSHVYHVRSGSGRTAIELSDGQTHTIHWSKSDTFAVPAWSKINHIAAPEEDAYLFVLSDRPVLESLNMYVSE